MIDILERLKEAGEREQGNAGQDEEEIARREGRKRWRFAIDSLAQQISKETGINGADILCCFAISTADELALAKLPPNGPATIPIRLERPDYLPVECIMQIGDRSAPTFTYRVADYKHHEHPDGGAVMRETVWYPLDDTTRPKKKAPSFALAMLQAFNGARDVEHAEQMMQEKGKRVVR